MSEISFQLRPSRSRRRVIRIAIHADGSVVVTASRSIARSVVETFVQRHAAWIGRQKEKRAAGSYVALRGDREEYTHLRERARTFTEERLREICDVYALTYRELSIRNTQTRWGSCSRHGRLSIHYKILFLPLPLANYLIVHEVCHLKEMNHSARFWKLVARAVPDYLMKRRALRVWIQHAESVRLS